MNILIINSAEPDERSFVDPIQAALSNTKAHTQIREYTEVPDTCDVNAFDAVIISASPKGDDIVGDHMSHFQWLLTYQKPVLGICAGHQTIGTLFGGDLIRGKEAEEGDTSVQITKRDPIFEGLEDEFPVEQHHNDSITLPKDFELLATSPVCGVQAIRHKEHPLYSVQWHAEISNPELIQNFVNRVVKETSGTD